jgi:hypothetical protein
MVARPPTYPYRKVMKPNPRRATLRTKKRCDVDPSEFAKKLEAASDVLIPPHQIVEKELREVCSFLIGHFPSETFSDDEPPFRRAEQAETFPIDGLLGLYSPDDQRITIFNKGLTQISRLLSVKADDLKMIVRIHEWAHALVHLGMAEGERIELLKDDSKWACYRASADGVFAQIETTLHERLAQLITFHGIRSLQQAAKSSDGRAALARIEDVFDLLCKRQPAAYQIKKYQNLPKHRIIRSIRMLKKEWLKGSAEAWEEVITW